MCVFLGLVVLTFSETTNRQTNNDAHGTALAHLAWQTRGNPELRKRLTPNYQLGCKRVRRLVLDSINRRPTVRTNPLTDFWGEMRLFQLHPSTAVPPTHRTNPLPDLILRISAPSLPPGAGIKRLLPSPAAPQLHRGDGGRERDPAPGVAALRCVDAIDRGKAAGDPLHHRSPDFAPSHHHNTTAAAAEGGATGSGKQQQPQQQPQPQGRFSYPRPPSPPPPNGNMGNSGDGGAYERRWAQVEEEGGGGRTGGVIVDEEGNAHEVDVIIYATGERWGVDTGGEGGASSGPRPKAGRSIYILPLIDRHTHAYTLPLSLSLSHTHTHTLPHAYAGFKVKDGMEQAPVVGRDGVVLHERFRCVEWNGTDCLSVYVRACVRLHVCVYVLFLLCRLDYCLSVCVHTYLLPFHIPSSCRRAIRLPVTNHPSVPPRTLFRPHHTGIRAGRRIWACRWPACPTSA